MLLRYYRLIPRSVLIVAMICSGLTLGGVVGQVWFGQSTGNADHFGWGFPQPANLDELVRSSDLIVVATIGPITNQGLFNGYDAQGKEIPPAESGFDPRAMPFVDYSLSIEQVIKADRASNDRAPMTLRMPANRTRKITAEQLYPMSAPGDRHLFFLGRNPDGTYGLLYGPWSRFMIDSPVVSYSDGARSRPAFANHVSPNNFFNQLSITLAEQP